MKKLLLTTALVAGFGISAQAQEAGSEMFRAGLDAMDIRASDFIGMRIYATETELSGDAYDGAQTDWNDIGEINDILLTREGDVAAVLVDIGGFLGMGERQVAVNMSALRIVSDSMTADNEGDFFLVMNANQASLEGAPAFQMDGQTMGSTDGAAATGGTSDTATTAEGGTSDTTSTDMTAADTAAGGAADISGTAGSAMDATTTDGTMATDGTIATDGTVTTGTDGTGGTATDSGVTTATDGTAMTDGTATTDGTAPTDGATTTAARTPIVRDGFMAADGDYLTTEKLTGARVYDSTDTWIGDVSELVIDESGKINSAIVDVGGFLGMGAKPVALTMQDLDIIRNEAGNEVRVYLSYTKDQLNEMETFAN